MKINSNKLHLFTLGIVLLVLADNTNEMNEYNPGPSEYFDEMLIVEDPDRLILYWKHNQTDIIFELHYKSFGWIMFGLSHSGLNQYSDVIVAWLNNDLTGHFSDRHIIYKTPIIDKVQNWSPLLFERRNNFTMLKFSRKLTICGSAPQDEIDIDIMPNNNYLIYAYGDTFIKDDKNNVDIDASNAFIGKMTVDLIGMSDNFNLFECMNPVYSEVQTTPTGFYMNNFDVVPNIYKIFWNSTKDKFIAEVHVRNKKWFCFGFSSSGKIEHSSDLVFGWFSHSVAHFKDALIFDNTITEDQVQNWNLISAYELDNYIIFKFSRDIVLCDLDDLTIDNGSPYVIYGYGNEDLKFYGFTNLDLNEEAFGITQIAALNNRITNENDLFPRPSDSNAIEFSLHNVVLPNLSNFYFYCKLFKIGLYSKYHIYKWQAALSNRVKMNIQHVILYECDFNYYGDPYIGEGDCLGNPLKNKYCKNVGFIWSRGSDEIQYFPDDTGYPIGGDTDYNYVLLEIHYQNFENTLGFIDSLSIIFYITQSLRENELGTLKLGTESDPIGIMIPPRQETFNIKSLCSNECLKSKLNGENLTVIKTLARTNSAGKQIYTIIIRDDQSMEYLHWNNYYNYNYQNHYSLIPRINITEDDNLLTECVYSSLDRNQFTYGGFSVSHEICQQYLLYYPRNKKFKYCESFPDIYEQYQLLFRLKEREDLNIDLDQSSSEYNSVLGKIYSGYELIKSLTNVSDAIVAHFRDLYARSSYYSICQSNFDMSSLSKLISYDVNLKQTSNCQQNLQNDNNVNSNSNNNNNNYYDISQKNLLPSSVTKQNEYLVSRSNRFKSFFRFTLFLTINVLMINICY